MNDKQPMLKIWPVVKIRDGFARVLRKCKENERVVNLLVFHCIWKHQAPRIDDVQLPWFGIGANTADVARISSTIPVYPGKWKFGCDWLCVRWFRKCENRSWIAEMRSASSKFWLAPLIEEVEHVGCRWSVCFELWTCLRRTRSVLLLSGPRIGRCANFIQAWVGPAHQGLVCFIFQTFSWKCIRSYLEKSNTIPVVKMYIYACIGYQSIEMATEAISYLLSFIISFLYCIQSLKILLTKQHGSFSHHCVSPSPFCHPSSSWSLVVPIDEIDYLEQEPTVHRRVECH